MITQLVNPTHEEIHKLPVGESFIVRGTLARNVQESRWQPSYPGSSRMEDKSILVVHITTDTGDCFTLEGFRYPLRYRAGSLENLRDCEANVGEILSVTAHVVMTDGRKGVTIGYEQAELLVPSDARQARYDKLRAEVAELMSQLQAELAKPHYPAARVCFAKIRHLMLTKAERRILAQHVATMPLAERPVHDPDSTYHRDAIEKAFGVDIEELNAESYLAFARHVLYGEAPNPDGSNHTDESYMFDFLNQPMFTSAQAVHLALTTYQIRIEQLAKTSASGGKNRSDSWVCERCIEHLGYLAVPAAIEALAWIIDHALEYGYFDHRISASEQRGPYTLSSILEKAIGSLHSCATYGNVKMPSDFDAGRLLKWRNTISAYPFEAQTADKLRAAIRPLTSF